MLARAAILGAAAVSLVSAATVTHDFNITWVTANPDGAFARPVIGVNGQWPVPRIEADVGDRIVINVNNQLGNQTTSLHFHGLFMKGSSHMDGPTGVSQCPIPPGASFTYNFTIEQPGTYWYHSHDNAQYPDGLRGPLIVNDPDFPYKDQVDHELVLTLSDWYHDQMATLIPKFMSKGNPSGAEPVPQAALMNDTQDYSVPVEAGKTYMFRVINMGAFAGQYIWFESHSIRIIEVDGVYTKPAEADMVYIAAAQRVSFLLTTKNETTANFPIVASMDTSLFDDLPEDLNYNVTGWLTYDEKNPFPKPTPVAELDPIDDMTLVPYDEMPLLPEPDRIIELNAIMDNLRDGKNYAFFNNITWTTPKVPSLYSALTAGDAASDPAVYGAHTNAYVLEKDEIVQIVVNNLDDGRHPFHLHGHHFQVIYRSEEDAGAFDGAGDVQFDKTPMRRDTVSLWPNGNIVLRFKANNPGVWLFHCHIEWHVVSGLIATFIEDPLTLQSQLTLPPDHLAACSADNIPTKGNAAGNTEDLFDLTGQNAPPPRLPDGFEPRGIVALVFSCIAGVLGVAIVAWYGIDQPDEADPDASVAARVEGSSPVANDAPDDEEVLILPASNGLGSKST